MVRLAAISSDNLNVGGVKPYFRNSVSSEMTHEETRSFRQKTKANCLKNMKTRLLIADKCFCFAVCARLRWLPEISGWKKAASYERAIAVCVMRTAIRVLLDIVILQRRQEPRKLL